MKQIAIINGPNLNLVGVREPDMYGTRPLDGYLDALKSRHPELDIEVYQSNIEGEIVSLVQEVGFRADGIVINPGGYSHTSVAIHDALKAVKAPAVEVHISNIHAREEFRHRSLTGAACMGVVSGLGLLGYDLAIEYLASNSERGEASCR